MTHKTRAAGFPALTFVLVLALAPVLTSAPLLAEPPDDLMLTSVTSGLTRPVAVRNAGDGSDRLFIVEQPGRIQLYRAGEGLSLFLDINGKVDDSSNEQGLLGLAFHPDYETNGFFYVNYTADPGPGLDRTVIERYTVSAGDPDVADAASGFVILEIEQDFSNHNGGDIHFGPDGYLYIGMGDGGSGGDPNDRAQDLEQLLGKMLRIDVDGTTPDGANDLCGLSPVAGHRYAIPPDNPFAGGSDDCDEIWAYGFRNPWRWSFDRLRHDLFIGDVGQGSWEEVDFQPASSTGGENYGWNCREGAHPFPGGSTCTGPVVDPILEYPTGNGCAVTGGFRYSGNAISGFRNVYVYGDYCAGLIWFATESGGGNWSTTLWQDTSLSPVSFGEDEHGELYLASLGGTVYRFTSPSSIFADDFESGDVSGWSSVGDTELAY